MPRSKVCLFYIVICLLTFFFCEYLIYFTVIMQCSWPNLDPKQADQKIIKPDDSLELQALFLADTHLLGPYHGHWFDKLRREWQMHRAFQTIMSLYNPQVVFILGDLFDEGQFCTNEQFNNYIVRLSHLFEIDKSKRMYVVPGNHDLGFHYRMRYDLYKKFNSVYNTSAVQFKKIKGNYFILINSMALHRDNCYFCKEAENKIHKLANKLECLKQGKSCNGLTNLQKYVRPIVLQHFPMYRESDAACDGKDSAPKELKSVPFREKWECLSRNASEMIYDLLNPRLILTGHTHHGCTVRHRDDIIEHTLPSFNWRNKNNPSFMLGVFTANNYALSKCYIPEETTVINTYLVAVLGSVILLICISRLKSLHFVHNTTGKGYAGSHEDSEVKLPLLYPK